MNFFIIVLLLIIVTCINLYFGLNCVNPNGKGMMSNMKRNLTKLLQLIGFIKKPKDDSS